MTIREELINLGYDNEYVDERAKIEYEIRKPVKRKFKDTKIGIILCSDWGEILFNCLCRKIYQKQMLKERKARLEEIRKRGFVGDKNNSDDVLKYEQSLENDPIESICTKNEDGSTSYVHKFADGLEARVNVTLSSIFPEGFDVYSFLAENEKNRKRLLADYLNLDEELVLNMNEKELEKELKKNYGKRKK